MRWGEGRRRTLAVLVGLSCAWSTVGVHAVAQDGTGLQSATEADPFYAGDWVPVSLDTPREDRYASLAAVDPQGRVILASNGRDPRKSWTCAANAGGDQQAYPETQSAYAAYLERYLPSGQLDTSFGDNGLVTIPQLAPVQGLRTMEVLPDGSAIVVMEGESRGCLPDTYIQRDIALRITASGEWDEAWTPGGARITDIFGIFALTLEGESAVLAGDSQLHEVTQGTWTQAALPANSSPQSMAFGSAWLALDGIPPTASDGIPPGTGLRVSLIPRDDLMGRASQPTSSFIPLGLPEVHFVSMKHLYAWDPQGRLIAVSSVHVMSEPYEPGTTPSVQDSYFVVNRMLVESDGSVTLDPDFGAAGSVVFRPEPIGRPEAWTHALQLGTDPQGRVLILGSAPVPGYGYTNMALRLTSDGRPDPAFGTAGITPLPVEAVMQGPAAIDRAGRWFGAAEAGLLDRTTRRGDEKPATLRMSPTGTLSASVGDGWRTVPMPRKRPARLAVVSLSGCDATGRRGIEAVVKVRGRSGDRWQPLKGASVDLTVEDANGNSAVLMRGKTGRHGTLRLMATIDGRQSLGFYFGRSNTHLDAFVTRTCGAA